MRTRVLKYGELYYPQYKGWFLWHNIIVDGAAVYCISEKDAINYVTSDRWRNKEIVVWESED